MEDRPSDDTEISIEDLRTCGWQEVIESAEADCYASIWSCLAAAAKEATERGRNSQGKALRLLSDAASMMLSPPSLTQPFRPIIVAGQKRSPMPEDFNDRELELFAIFAKEISVQKLCARIADLVWFRQRPRDPQFAKLAIDNYLERLGSTDAWIKGGGKCYERAIQLCSLIKTDCEARLESIRAELQTRFFDCSCEDGFLGLWISDLLIKYNLLRDSEDKHADTLKSIGEDLEALKDYSRSRDYFKATAAIYATLSQTQSADSMIVRIAESFIAEASARREGQSTPNLAASGLLEQALLTYRSIPKSRRSSFSINERIVEVRNSLQKANERALGEMGRMRSRSPDIGHFITESMQAVSGRIPLEAISILSNIHGPTSAVRARDFARDTLKAQPFVGLMHGTYYSRDGRVVAKSPGSFDQSEDEESVLWPHMIRYFTLQIGLIVQARIWPALETIRQEHAINEADFFQLTRLSPILPLGRERLASMALFAGFDNDFTTALHILVPQVEHLVRHHLKLADVHTTHIDANGIENENGLSTLIQIPKAEAIFGSDFVFEVRALFCDPVGPNLRNELAHGLIDQADGQSIYSIYAWWFFLRIIVRTFRSKVENSSEDAPPEAEN